MPASSIYQRTDAGCLEIQLKKQGLTQSERLILMNIDVLDAVQIERFLHQEPLDPVTILSFDVDYDDVGQQDI